MEVDGVADEHHPFPQPADQPLGIKGRYIGSSAGADNHRAFATPCPGAGNSKLSAKAIAAKIAASKKL